MNFIKNKKFPQILIIIDIITLLLFMYIYDVKSNVRGKVKIEYSNGLVDGTRIVVKNEYNKTIDIFNIKYGRPNRTKEKNYSGFYQGYNCPKSVCYSKYLRNLGIKYPESYNFSVFFPEDSMTKAYGILHGYCDKYKCNGNIYIDAGYGTAQICAKDNQYKYLNNITGEVEEGVQCSYY